MGTPSSRYMVILHAHWSLRVTKNSWSTVTSSSATASSKVLTISTSRPVWVPSNAPRTEMAEISPQSSANRLFRHTKGYPCPLLETQTGKMFRDVEDRQWVAELYASVAEHGNRLQDEQCDGETRCGGRGQDDWELISVHGCHIAHVVDGGRGPCPAIHYSVLQAATLCGTRQVRLGLL